MAYSVSEFYYNKMGSKTKDRTDFEEKNDEFPSINSGKPTIAVNKGNIFRRGSNLI